MFDPLYKILAFLFVFITDGILHDGSEFAMDILQLHKPFKNLLFSKDMSVFGWVYTLKMTAGCT